MSSSSEHSSIDWNDGTSRDPVGKAVSISEVEASEMEAGEVEACEVEASEIESSVTDGLADGVGRGDVSDVVGWTL